MQSTFWGQWGPGGPAVLVTSFLVFVPHTRWRLYFGSAVRLRTIRVIGGLFFGSEAAAALYRVSPRRSAAVLPCVRMR